MGGHHRIDSVRKRRHRGPQLITGQTRISGTRQPIYVVEILGETEAQNKNRDVRNQEKRTSGKTNAKKLEKKASMQFIRKGRGRRESKTLFIFILRH